MASGKRREGESFEDYKKRLRMEEKMMRQRLKYGFMFWHGSQGTYRKQIGA